MVMGLALDPVYTPKVLLPFIEMVTLFLRMGHPVFKCSTHGGSTVARSS